MIGMIGIFLTVTAIVLFGCVGHMFPKMNMCSEMGSHMKMMPTTF